MGGDGSRCPACGMGALTRLRSVSREGAYYSYHCLSCQEVPCFVSGCDQRASIQVRHTTGPYSGNPNWHPPTFRNDVALCANHQFELFKSQQKGARFYISKGLAGGFGALVLWSAFELLFEDQTGALIPRTFYWIAGPLAGIAGAAAAAFGDLPSLPKKDDFRTKYAVPTPSGETVEVVDFLWPTL